MFIDWSDAGFAETALALPMAGDLAVVSVTMDGDGAVCSLDELLRRVFIGRPLRFKELTVEEFGKLIGYGLVASEHDHNGFEVHAISAGIAIHDRPHGVVLLLAHDFERTFSRELPSTIRGAMTTLIESAEACGERLELEFGLDEDVEALSQAVRGAKDVLSKL